MSLPLAAAVARDNPR